MDRARAAADLGRIGDIRALDFLLEALNSESKFVRSSAAEAIGNLRGVAIGKAVEPLAHLAINDPYESVNIAARESLKKIREIYKV